MTPTHQAVLELVDSLRSLAVDWLAVQLAAWYHDVVYDTRAEDNEERSAAHADDLLGKLSAPDSARRRDG